MSVPLPIETERLVLRQFEPGDATAMSAIYGDPEVMRHVGTGVLDRDGSAALLSRYARAQDEYGFSTWAVVERASGRLVGDAGFDVYAPTGDLELGYTLAADVWGRGYASEAARACIGAAFAHLPAPRIVAKIEPGNDRSFRVADRLGLRRVETVHVDGRPHVLLALERA